MLHAGRCYLYFFSSFFLFKQFGYFHVVAQMSCGCSRDTKVVVSIPGSGATSTCCSLCCLAGFVGSGKTAVLTFFFFYSDSLSTLPSDPFFSTDPPKPSKPSRKLWKTWIFFDLPVISILSDHRKKLWRNGFVFFFCCREPWCLMRASTYQKK